MKTGKVSENKVGKSILKNTNSNDNKGAALNSSCAYLSQKEDKEEIMKCVYPEDISLELLKKVYGHYAFVDEDFFCNIKEEKTEETENDDLRIEQQGGII